MNIKSEKGFSVMDISIAVAVMFIFVSLIAVLTYNFNSDKKEIEIRSKALDIAVGKIEEIKRNNEIKIENVESKLGKEFDTNQEGYKGTIQIIDGNKMSATNGTNHINNSNLVKKVTVKVEYKFKKETKSIELSTIISKE